MRRLAVPSLRDGDQVRVDVVIEIDYATQCVGDGGDAAKRVMIYSDVVPITLLDLCATVFVINLDEAELGLIGGAHHQTRAAIGQLQIR